MEQDGTEAWTFENLVDAGWNYQDVVATDEFVFVAAQLDEQFVIGRFETNGDPSALFYLGAGTSLAVEPLGADLVYASKLEDDNGTELGRISMSGEQRWSSWLGGDDIVGDIALTSTGHMYVVSQWAEQAWRLRRIHP
jgi:hypothetical protein